MNSFSSSPSSKLPTVVDSVAETSPSVRHGISAVEVTAAVVGHAAVAVGHAAVSVVSA